MDSTVIAALITAMGALLVGGLALVGSIYSVNRTHKVDQHLEEFRAEINARLNMISKVQDREFKVLSGAWALLQAADTQTKAAVRQAREGLAEAAIDEAVQAIDRFQRYFEYNRIFICGDLLDAFRRVDAILIQVRTDCDRIASDHARFMDYVRDIEAGKSKIEVLIRERLPLL